LDIAITPAKLTGRIEAVESKSDAHRLLICAALSGSPTEIMIKNMSNDILATVGCLTAMGCGMDTNSESSAVITPLWQNIAGNPVLDCGESGSTLRFLLPVAAAVCGEFTITGSGRLPQRPLTPVIEAMQANGCVFNSEKLPLHVSGKLNSGKFELPGDVSSQFISGLLFALPLLAGQSEINLTSPLQSAGYVDMTLDTLSKFGVLAICEKDRFIIPGAQQYISPGSIMVEGDWSNAAFWLAAGAMNSSIVCTGLDQHSLQSDRRIVEILKQMGADIVCENGTVRVSRRELNAITLDAAEIPDLVPVMAAVMAVAKGRSVIKNAGRVRLKESDRLAAIAKNLNLLGADVRETEDSLIINGKPKLAGGTTTGCGDHRIVMALAAVSVVCEKAVVIKGADAVEKSYPGFFGDFNKLGGLANVI
jgi:3-phosphoshikimate 1-carboxyvinyltransferase